ncbi:hypothetical protein BJ170DRAFT_342702 [Xylariales sp. AK1849]|nr:hypothetical protein BJ170DRAFT_342702 [Xylariales sp. AK1849]
MYPLATLSLLALLGAVNGQSTVGFGPYFSLGPTSSWIREATTTLVLPDVPSPAKDRLALWPGMGTSDGDLVQALAVAFSDPDANCGASDGQWCTWASTLENGTQLGGTEVPASAGTQLLFHYVYNDTTSKYDQTVSVDGTVISSLSTSSGEAEGFGTAVECQDNACDGTVAAHQYLNTVVILDAADSSFGDTLALNEATTSGLSTSNGGITWSVETVDIQEHTFAL